MQAYIELKTKTDESDEYILIKKTLIIIRTILILLTILTYINRVHTIHYPPLLIP